MEAPQIKYFQFPLFLMKPMATNPGKTLENIFFYGLFRYADGLQVDTDKIAERVIYSWNTDANMAQELRELLEESGFSKDEDYRGFVGGQFEPTDQIIELNDLRTWNEELYLLTERHAKIETAVYNIGKVFNTQITRAWEKWEWYNNLTVPDREPFPQINIELLLKYIHGYGDQYNILQLAAFIGITSILGKAAYKRTNKAFIVARMLGYKSPQQLPVKKPPLYLKYTTRYHFDRLKILLQLNWNLHFESKGIKGYYIGNAGKIDMVDLKVEVKKHQYKARIMELKAKEAEAEKEARKKFQHLYKE